MTAGTFTERESPAGPALCRSCEARNLCFAHGADAEALAQLDAAVERRIRLGAGQYLYRIGDPFRSLYAVRSGCLMNSLHDNAGREQVAGFHLLGDVVGVGGIGHEAYVFDMRALEPSEVCEVPFERLEALASRVPALRGNILKIFARYRDRDAGTQSLRRKGSAEARVAAFLLDFSERLAARGRDAARFRLPMSRADIASHLGLSTAAVSRVLALLRRRGIANVVRSAVEISDRAGLQSLAAGRG